MASSSYWKRRCKVMPVGADEAVAIEEVGTRSH